MTSALSKSTLYNNCFRSCFLSPIGNQNCLQPGHKIRPKSNRIRIRQQRTRKFDFCKPYAAKCSCLLLQRVRKSAKKHAKRILKLLVNWRLIKDAKISGKNFPRAVQNYPKWPFQTWGNRVPMRTETPRSRQEDCQAQDHLKMLLKWSRERYKIGHKSVSRPCNWKSQGATRTIGV